MKSSIPEVTKQKYTEIGYQALLEGKIALVILAGGQSTRMGTDVIKGAIDIGLPSSHFSILVLCYRKEYFSAQL